MTKTVIGKPQPVVYVVAWGDDGWCKIGSTSNWLSRYAYPKRKRVRYLFRANNHRRLERMLHKLFYERLVEGREVFQLSDEDHRLLDALSVCRNPLARVEGWVERQEAQRLAEEREIERERRRQDDEQRYIESIATIPVIDSPTWPDGSVIRCKQTRVDPSRTRYCCTRVACGHTWIGKTTDSGMPAQFCPACKRRTAQVIPQ